MVLDKKNIKQFGDFSYFFFQVISFLKNTIIKSIILNFGFEEEKSSFFSSSKK